MTSAQARQLATEINDGTISLPRVQYARVFRFSSGSCAVRLEDCDGQRVRMLRTALEVLAYVGWNAR